MAYNETIAKDIIKQISEGKSLRKACVKKGYPTPQSFYDWIKRKDYLLNGSPLIDQYTHAREVQAEGYADDIMHIVDTEEDTNRARLKVDAIKWIASKLKPKVYGDKQLVGVDIKSTVDISSRLERAMNSVRLQNKPHTETIDVIPSQTPSE